MEFILHNNSSKHNVHIEFKRQTSALKCLDLGSGTRLFSPRRGGLGGGWGRESSGGGNRVSESIAKE